MPLPDFRGQLDPVETPQRSSSATNRWDPPEVRTVTRVRGPGLEVLHGWPGMTWEYLGSSRWILDTHGYSRILYDSDSDQGDNDETKMTPRCQVISCPAQGI